MQITRKLCLMLQIISEKKIALQYLQQNRRYHSEYQQIPACKHSGKYCLQGQEHSRHCSGMGWFGMGPVGWFGMGPVGWFGMGPVKRKLRTN